MSTVITESQARQITGGRKPLVPVEYESAITALIACMSIDDAKYWSDKSDALAAWAKIYKQDETGRQAKRLKLHAFRRMGEIAAELQGDRPSRGRGNKGPGTTLIASGLSARNATAAVRLSRAPQPKFNTLVERAVSVGRANSELIGVSGANYRRSSDSWRWLTSTTAPENSTPHLLSVRSALRRRAAKEVAAGISDGEIIAARSLAVELMEWLDEFEQYLPKSS